MPEKLVSIIIPCKDKSHDISGLLNDISVQKKSFDTEVIRITAVSPPGRARNMGAKKACGQILVFIDCDIRLGNDYYLSNLVGALEGAGNTGAACASLRLPKDASGFQLRYAKEIAHCESPIVDKPIEVFVAASACFAISKELFSSLRGFNENIIRGEDSELSLRLNKAGYRIVLAANTWCYHPAPGNIRQLAKINFRNGAGVAFVDTFYPELNIDVHPQGIDRFSSRKTIMERGKRFVSAGFAAIIKKNNLLVLAKINYLAGYAYGVFKYRVFRFKN
jgi:glycosyltransferase involved in cell wall biosynthesis